MRQKELIDLAMQTMGLNRDQASKALEGALQYVKRNGFAQFLDASQRLLSPQQKMCAILNAADLAMGDGHLAPSEQQMLQQVATAWQIPEQYLGPYIQALMVKNNLAVFA